MAAIFAHDGQLRWEVEAFPADVLNRLLDEGEAAIEAGEFCDGDAVFDELLRRLPRPPGETSGG